ncbi:DUF2922 family protein [Peptoniphilus gorbachii]
MAILLLLLKLLKKFLKVKPNIFGSMMFFMKGDVFMKQTKTLKMSFADEGGNPWNLTILNPKEGITSVEAKAVGDIITNNNLVNGKVGHVKSFNGALLVTRTEDEI